MGESCMPKTGTDEHNEGYENNAMHLGHAGMKLAFSEPKTLIPSAILLLKVSHTNRTKKAAS